MGECVAAVNLATLSAGDSRSHVAGQPGQQNATFCPLKFRTRLAGTLAACMGVPMMGQFVLANTGFTCRSSAVARLYALILTGEGLIKFAET